MHSNNAVMARFLQTEINCLVFLFLAINIQYILKRLKIFIDNSITVSKIDFKRLFYKPFVHFLLIKNLDCLFFFLA